MVPRQIIYVVVSIQLRGFPKSSDELADHSSDNVRLAPSVVRCL